MAFQNGLKICPRCKEPKSKSDYGPNVARCDGVSVYCRPCTRIVTKERDARLRAAKRPDDGFVVDHPSLKTIIRLFSLLSYSAERQWNGSPCWESTGRLDDSGYGTFKWKDEQIRLHRFMFAWIHEPIPSFTKTKLTIDHQCRNRSCFNPAHLRILPSVLNVSERRSHCKYGHEYTPENTYIQPSRPASRSCVQCRKDRDAKRWRKQ